MRHAARPATTLTIFARSQHLPFDVANLRALPYDLAAGNQYGESEAQALLSAVTQRLEELRSLSHQASAPDSPLFQLLADYPAPDISRLKTDLIREQLEAVTGIQRRLAAARDQRDSEALKELAGSLDMETTEAGILVDLFLSFRALSMWEEMVALHERLPAALKRAVMVREQLGLALNRVGRRDEAARVLNEVIEDHGPSSETYGILGRVHKDQWTDARKQGAPAAVVEAHLAKAVDTYVRGFDSDWRDAYPGINAVTLLEIQGDTARRDRLLPAVRFAAERRISGQPDYWDQATLLELAVLAGDEREAVSRLSAALASVREPWEPATTANNLGLIRDARARRGEEQPWLDELIAGLQWKAS